MTHVRKQIRDQMAQNLVGLTTTGSRVFDSRLFNFANAELPALAIYTKSEASERDTIGTLQGLTRTLTVQVEGYAAAPVSGALAQDMENTLDKICEECETALASDPTVSGLAIDSFISGTEIDYQGQEAEVSVGTVVMDWSVTYRTNTTAPGTAL
tara:strand:- start:578 stop:1042 length:465 start_codon:yes stop_codon:yes gene_type:complete